MSLEYPTLFLPSAKEEVVATMEATAKKIGAEVEQDELKTELSHEHDLKLTDDELDGKLSRLASEKYKPKTMFFVVFGVFALILSVLGLETWHLTLDEVSKKEVYFQALKDVDAREKGIITLEGRKRRAGYILKGTMVMFVLAILFISLIIKVRLEKDKKMGIAREEVVAESKESKQDLSIDHKVESLKFRLFSEGDKTEVIFLDERANAYLIYIIALVLESYKGKPSFDQIYANSPLQEIVKENQKREILALQADKSLLQNLI